MQADFVAFGFRDIRLQESPVRIQLDRQQVRRAENARPLAEVLTNALLFGERIGHVSAPFLGACAPQLTALATTSAPACKSQRNEQNGAADGCRRVNRRQPSNCASHRANSHYLMAALAPASSSFFLIVSASAFGMPSLTVEGAPSTRSFASFRPKPGDLADDLDDAHLVGAELGHGHGELGLRFGSRSRSRRRRPPPPRLPEPPP